jgi:hypothetical protein
MNNARGQIVFSEPLPDGVGGFGPCPAVMTEAEAIRFLRLDLQKAKPQNTLAHYRERGLLKATILGKNRFYFRDELVRFLGKLTSNGDEYLNHKR